MKKVFLATVLLATISIASYGQKIRFTDSTNRWTHYQFDVFHDGAIGMFVAYYGNDSIIHGKEYRMLWGNWIMASASTLPYVFIREDSISKKVFIATFHDSDTTERILYDYTLQVGDTFRCQYAIHHVSAIDSVLINAIWHKVWYFTADTCNNCPILFAAFNYHVIEGIGSTENSIEPLQPIHFEGGTEVTCFSTEGTTPPLSKKIGTYFDNAGSCSSTYHLKTNGILNKTENITLFPNPIDETSKIVLPKSISTGKLVIINAIGQTILKETFDHKTEIPVGNKITLSGVYHYLITNFTGNNSFSGTFIKQ